jgi:hypothetical protein
MATRICSCIAHHGRPSETGEVEAPAGAVSRGRPGCAPCGVQTDAFAMPTGGAQRDKQLIECNSSAAGRLCERYGPTRWKGVVVVVVVGRSVESWRPGGSSCGFHDRPGQCFDGATSPQHPPPPALRWPQWSVCDAQAAVLALEAALWLSSGWAQ